jgi:hypothetical protein
LVRKSEGNRSFERHVHRLENNIRMDLREMGVESYEVDSYGSG